MRTSRFALALALALALSTACAMPAAAARSLRPQVPPSPPLPPAADGAAVEPERAATARPVTLALADKAAVPADVQIQEATGQAAVIAGDKPAAREKAIADALRQAVQMAVGTIVTSTTEVENFQTKMDQVLTHTTGFVRKYDVVKEAMDNDVVQVTIRAQIGLGELNKDLAAVGLLLSRKNMPRTMVLIAEQNVGMAAPAAAWMKDKGGESALVSTDLRVAEGIMLDELRKAGFGQLIDPEIATSKAASVGGFTTSLTGQQARKIGSLTGAEVIIIGQVIATSRGPAEVSPDWRSCVASFNARAVSTDNGDILATSETTQNAMQLDDLTCGKESIKKAAKALTADLSKKIMERWSKDVSGGNQVHLVVKGVDGMKQASSFKKALGEYMRGVKGVNQRSFDDGVLELDLTLVGSTEEFATEVEAKKLGNFSVKVKGVSANTVTVMLGK